MSGEETSRFSGANVFLRSTSLTRVALGRLQEAETIAKSEGLNAAKQIGAERLTTASDCSRSES